MDLKILKRRFSRRSLFSFFLLCAFPFHIWTIIMLIRDASWIIERSGTDSFIGVASIAMIYALAESLLFFLLLLALGLLIPWRWSAKKVYALLGFIALWVPVWDIAFQVYRATDVSNPKFFVKWLFSTQHPLWYGYPLLVLIPLSMIVLTAMGIWLISFNQKFQERITIILERIAILSAIYLILDLASIVALLLKQRG